MALAAAGGVLIGLLGWLLFPLTVGPLLHGQAPTWSAGAAADVCRDLVGDLLHGGLTGVILQGVFALLAGRARHGPHPQRWPRCPAW